MDTTELALRKQLARELLAADIEPIDLELRPDPLELQKEAGLMANLGLVFPDDLGPEPTAIEPAPDPASPLPKADAVVVTWTVDELQALADVLTPGISRNRWYRYNRKFAEYLPKIRNGAPARAAQRLGSYYMTMINGQKVLCIKSELHLNQDGVQKPPVGQPGNASLPVKDFFHQIMDEAEPKFFFTAGTAGAVFAEHDLGDVVVTRGAKFRCASEFRNAPFNNKHYKSDWEVPTDHFDTAEALMQRFKNRIQNPPVLPPTSAYENADQPLHPTRENVPGIILEGRDMPEFHPILTTDFFEFGTSTNQLEAQGSGVEMGDAVLGLAVEERAAAGKPVPKWLVLRNCSDPQINGLLHDDPRKTSLQALWAVYFYRSFGYWTSVMSSLATWAILAGLRR
jgi:hypothetical protein